MRAQGTIEYLIIVAIVIVIALLVSVILSTSITDSGNILNNFGAVSSSKSGAISILASVSDSNGDSLFSLLNLSGENIQVTKIILDGRDNNYSSELLYPGDNKLFSFANVGSGCNCENGFSGTRTCDLIINYTSSSGLEKTFSTKVIVNCTSDTTSSDTNSVVQHVGFCGSERVIGTAVSSCTTISSSGNYTLTQNIGSGGECLRVVSDNVTINGNNCTITGSINADGDEDPQAGHIISISNATVTEFVSANGATSLTESGIAPEGGSITLVNSNVSSSVTAKGGEASGLYGQSGSGGVIVLQSSTIGSASVSGGYAEYIAAGGGEITLINSVSSGEVTADSGYAAAGYGVANGGTIRLNSSRAAWLSATSLGGSAVNSAGGGGIIIVENNSIVSGNITATSSSCSDICPSTGPGGDVNIFDSTVGWIDVSGNGGYFISSSGGKIYISNSTTNALSADGGSSGVGGGNSGGKITAINSMVGAIYASGGGSIDAGTGPGGTIILEETSAGDIIVDSGSSEQGVYSSGTGGSVSLLNSSTGNIFARELAGSTNAPSNGGAITIQGVNSSTGNCIVDSAAGTGGTINIDSPCPLSANIGNLSCAGAIAGSCVKTCSEW